MMMEHQINQFLTEQREHVDSPTYRDRDRDKMRDRDRRRDRDRDRDRDRPRDRDRDGRRRRDDDGRSGRRHRDRSRERRAERSRSASPSDTDLRSGEYYEGGFGDTPYQSYDFVYNSSTSGKGHGDDGRSYVPDDFAQSNSKHEDDYSRSHSHSPPSKQRDQERRGSPPASSAPTLFDTMPRGEEKGGEKWMTDQPTNTVLLRGLATNIDEKDIRAQLMLFGAPIREVRLMRKKETGVSRGFAFVEFQSVDDAKRWMDMNQGQLSLVNQHPIGMYYSTPRINESRDARSHQEAFRQDWICSKCGVHNFKRRDFCFKCNISKEESERAKDGDGFDQVGNNPCNTLIFRGLDALTTEDTVTAAVSRLSNILLKNCQIIRDESTGASKGFGFIELNSIQESTLLLTILQSQEPFEVDGKAIIPAFAKNTFSTTMSTLNQYSSGGDGSDFSQSFPAGAQYDASTGQYYDPQTGQYYDYAQYYQQYQAEKNSQSDVTNAAAAVAQAAIAQTQQVKQIQKQQEDMQKQIVAHIQHQQKVVDVSPPPSLVHRASEWTTQEASSSSSESTVLTGQPSDAGEFPRYPVPDVSTYQYDETSGYYYDPSTGLYYDSSSQYYYNATTTQFMYWDGDRSTYLPAPSGVGDNQADKPEEKRGKDKEKKEKVKVAKKIAKDMEKWAKSMNAQKEAMNFKRSFQPVGGSGGVPSQQEKEAAAADAGFAILEKRMQPERKVDQKLMPPPPMPGKGQEGPGGTLVASYGSGDSDEEEAPDSTEDPQDLEAKMMDFSKMACLLCKRQFPNKEALQRHQQMSDLHKTNMENMIKSRAASASQGMQYRDRARERREKFGNPEPPLPRRKQRGESAPVPFEQPAHTKLGLGGENIGNKMMQKMGWSAGQGLGRSNQGRTDPIEAMQRQQSAGLGARGSNYQINPGDSYKETLKKVMFARYQDLE